MLELLITALMLGAHFEDVNHRYTVDLPTSWSFVPEISKQGSSAFRRVHGGVPAQAAIFTFRPPKDVGLLELIKTRTRTAKKQTGYRLINEGEATLGGFKGHRHKYEVLISKEKSMKKTVEEWMTVGRGFAYVVHVETLSEEFDSFGSDFSHIARTFSPLDGRVKRSASPLIGRWAMRDDESVVLALDRDGALAFGDVRGTFTVNGSILVTQLPGGAQEAFEWRLEGGELVLSSASMGVVRYRRMR